MDSPRCFSALSALRMYDCTTFAIRLPWTQPAALAMGKSQKASVVAKIPTQTGNAGKEALEKVVALATTKITRQRSLDYPRR